ncbi:hypothetical protein QK908_11295 [Lactococcus cremoris]
MLAKFRYLKITDRMPVQLMNNEHAANKRFVSLLTKLSVIKKVDLLLMETR